MIASSTSTYATIVRDVVLLFIREVYVATLQSI